MNIPGATVHFLIPAYQKCMQSSILIKLKNACMQAKNKKRNNLCIYAIELNEWIK